MPITKSEKKYCVIDLFAGCGGLSEGFKQAGFEIVAQIEMDKWACESLKTRCLYWQLKERNKIYFYQKYLRNDITWKDILNRFPEIKKIISYCVIQATFGNDAIEKILERIEQSRKYLGFPKFHVLLGGPPCQPYSVVGRSRDPHRMRHDDRHYLYEYYLRILEFLKPDFFVFENVPGLITANAKREEIFIRMLEDFSKINPPYEIAPSFNEYSRNPREYLVDSNNYGIPQKRKRVIFIGYRSSFLSKNKEIKTVFRKILRMKSPRWGGNAVEDAISDLPALRPGEGADGYYGSYIEKKITSYQNSMRRVSPGILNHRARTHMESDLERYKFFIDHHINGKQNANLIDLMRERPDLTPNHNHLDKFFDRFRVQWWTLPSSTITAHISKDGHYYIHPDKKQCRSFTVREAARCQSFQDNYKFEGSRTQQFRQVGNAVPPMLAWIIAKQLMAELKKIYEFQDSNREGL